MGALRAGLQAGLLNQSSAQVIDGSLKFNRDGSTRLEKTFSTSSITTNDNNSLVTYVNLFDEDFLKPIY